MGILLILIAYWIIMAYIWNSWEEKKRRKDEETKSNLPCSHGVRGGKILDRCPACREEEQDKKYEELRREREKKQRIYQEQERMRIDLEERRKLLKLSPREFEEFIADIYRKQGYSVQLTPYVNDGGKDIVITKNNNKYLIECKLYSEQNSVGRPTIQKLLGVVISEKAIGGIVVTTSYFTSEAREFAKKNNIKLIEREELNKLIRSF